MVSPSPSPECGADYKLSDVEQAMVELLYWAWNRKIGGLQKAIEHKFFYNPKGHKDKRGWWWPDPMIACDSNISHVIVPTKGKTLYDPWAWVKHCKTKGHITFLVKHRKGYVCNLLSNNAGVYNILQMLIDRTLLLNLNSKNKIVQIFIEDALAGRHWDNRELLQGKKPEVIHEL